MRNHSFKSVRWTVVAGLACLAAVTGRVYAEGEGPYLNADVGPSFLQGLPAGTHVDTGTRFSLVPGYRIYNDDILGISMQFETGVIWNSYKDSCNGDFNQGYPYGAFGGSRRTDLYQVPFMAGFEYAFHAGGIVEPYVSIAGGGVYTDAQNRSDSWWGQGYNNGYNGWYGQSGWNGQSGWGLEHKSSVSGAAQGGAGVRFKLNTHMELGVGYKFLASFPSGVDYLGTHSVSLTFVWRF
jgi:hypothetical protein